MTLTAHEHVVAEALTAQRRVDDDVNLAILEKIERVRTSLFQLVDPPNCQTMLLQVRRRASGGIEPESEF